MRSSIRPHGMCCHPYRTISMLLSLPKNKFSLDQDLQTISIMCFSPNLKECISAKDSNSISIHIQSLASLLRLLIRIAISAIKSIYFIVIAMLRITDVQYKIIIKWKRDKTDSEIRSGYKEVLFYLHVIFC